jgi:hypothetical protein
MQQLIDAWMFSRVCQVMLLSAFTLLGGFTTREPVQPQLTGLFGQPSRRDTAQNPEVSFFVNIKYHLKKFN